MAVFSAKFDVGERVTLDQVSDIVATVTEVSFRHDGKATYAIYQCEWLHNGVNYAAYIAGFRLTSVEKKGSLR